MLAANRTVVVGVVVAAAATAVLGLRVKVSSEQGNVFRRWSDTKYMKPWTSKGAACAVVSEVRVSNPNLTFGHRTIDL